MHKSCFAGRAAGIGGGAAAAVGNGVWLVLVLGGITYAELAVLREIGKRRGRRYLVITTDVLTAERVVRGAMR